MSSRKALDEILARLQTTFGVTLSAEEAERCTNPSDAAEVFADKVGARDTDESMHGLASHAVRDALTGALGPLPDGVRDDTELVALFPRPVFARQKAWGRFAEELGARLPPLPYGSPAVRGAALFSLSAFACFEARRLLGTLPPIEPWSFVPLALLAPLLIASLARRGFPVHLQMLGDVSGLLIREKATTLRTDDGWSRRQVGEVVAATFGTPPTRRMQLAVPWRVLVGSLVGGLVAAHLALTTASWLARDALVEELREFDTGRSEAVSRARSIAGWARADAAFDAELADAVMDPDVRVRWSAVYLLGVAYVGESHPEKSALMLERFFDRREHPEIRRAALIASARLGRRRGEPRERLLALLESDELAVEWMLGADVLRLEFGITPTSDSRAGVLEQAAAIRRAGEKR